MSDKQLPAGDYKLTQQGEAFGTLSIYYHPNKNTMVYVGGQNHNGAIHSATFVASAAEVETLCKAVIESLANACGVPIEEIVMGESPFGALG
jgi:hypothetical protein